MGKSSGGTAAVPATTKGTPAPALSAMQVAHEKPSRETDLYAWLLDQANELRARQPDLIDWDELAEELDEVVALARRETVSRVRTVLAHLLKWKYQKTKRDEPSWKSTIVRERLELALLLKSTNLRNYLDDEGYALAYKQARTQAGLEMGLERRARSVFPSTCEWDCHKEALNDDFFPSPARNSNGKSR
jgi:uncharacterized protein DUF29